MMNLNPRSGNGKDKKQRRPMKRPPMKLTRNNIQNSTNNSIQNHPPQLKRSEATNKYQNHRESFKKSKQDFINKISEGNGDSRRPSRQSSNGKYSSNKMGKLQQYHEYMRQMQKRFQSKQDPQKKVNNERVPVYRGRVSSVDAHSSRYISNSKDYYERPFWCD